MVHWFALLAANAVPALGWFAADWSPATTLVVYWFETAVGLVAIYLRGVLNQRWKPQRGHFEYEGTQSRGVRARGSFIKNFGFITFVFTAAHGFFIAVIVLILTNNGHADVVNLSWRSVGFGCLQILAIMAVDFFTDLPYLRTWTFRHLEQTANQSFGRIAVVHLALIFGMFVAAITDSPARMFGVFVVIKTLFSLSTALPQHTPAAPPAWLSRAMNRIRPEPVGKRFEDEWAADQAAEVKRLERNDKPWNPTWR